MRAIAPFFEQTTTCRRHGNDAEKNETEDDFFHVFKFLILRCKRLSNVVFQKSFSKIVKDIQRYSKFVTFKNGTRRAFELGFGTRHTLHSAYKYASRPRRDRHFGIRWGGFGVVAAGVSRLARL